MSASEELEQMAVRFANEAIQFDRQGSKSNAISRYERTVEILLKLCALYPEAPQNKLYMQQIENCKQRIRLLKEQNGRFEESDHTPRQPARLEQLVLTEKPNVKWNEIADLRDAKKAIEESIVFPVKRPDLFPLGWPRGILFFGPPGCGKTLLAAAIATEIYAVFYSVDAASIMSKWLGESEKNVAELFSSARQAAEVGKPVIIFIDEVDSLVGIRGDEVGGEVRTRNQFLKEMDNVLDKKRQTHVYVIGATNKPWALDEPFIRRFQKRIYVPLPTAESRQELYEIYAKNLKLASDVDRTLLVEKTEGYSGSDFRDIFQGAQTKVVREFFEGNHSKTQGQARAIAMDDFKDVLRKRKPSVSPQMLTLYDKWFETYKAL
ncbi:AAA family ATPase [archaeon RBG_16_50_20]|nr:MAG: AAA family ATPase [archaeon RBG_16_50_20]